MKKYMIPAAAALIIITPLIYILLRTPKEPQILSPVTVVYPDIPGADPLPGEIFAGLPEARVTLSGIDPELYSEELSSLLQGEGDLFYVVNHYGLKEFRDTLHKWSPGDFKNLPEAFSSFRRREDEFTYVPVTWSPWGLFYKKSLIKKFGFKEPSDWHEMMVLAEELKKEGITPVSLTDRFQWPLAAWFDYLNLRNHGPAFHEMLLSGQVSFTDQRVFKSFSELRDLIETGFFYTDTESDDWTVITDNLLKEKAAFVLGGGFFYDTFPGDIREDIAWIPFPSKGGEAAEIVSGSGFIVPEKESTEGARKFLNAILSERGQREIEEKSTLNPLFITHKSPGYLKRASKHITEETVLMASLQRNTHPALVVPLNRAILSLLEDESRENISELLETLERRRQNHVLNNRQRGTE